MEAGLILPLISLPTQGDRIHGLLGPLLLLLLLPLGYLTVTQWPVLRDPAWRLLTAVAAALATRAIVSLVPAEGLGGLAIWLGHSVVPMAIGIALWWRGGGLAAAEPSAADIRTEFVVLAGCLIGGLALLRPFLLTDDVLLGTSVGIFALGGLVAVALARQDAADVARLPRGRALAAGVAVLPALVAILLVSLLRPALLSTMWLTLATLIELALTPLGWLVSWLASLFPAGEARPLEQFARPRFADGLDPVALAQLQERLEWIGWVVLFTLLVVGTVAALLVVRILLRSGFVLAPRARAARPTDVQVESAGTARGDAQDFMAWLMRWVRGRVQRTDGAPALAAPVRSTSADAGDDPRQLYRRVLDWAAQRGLPRRPAETTGQLQSRLAAQEPELAAPLALLTETYEWDRYGQLVPPHERLRRAREALASVLTAPNRADR
jgi:hypothetical protein